MLPLWASAFVHTALSTGHLVGAHIVGRLVSLNLATKSCRSAFSGSVQESLLWQFPPGEPRVLALALLFSRGPHHPRRARASCPPAVSVAHSAAGTLRRDHPSKAPGTRPACRVPLFPPGLPFQSQRAPLPRSPGPQGSVLPLQSQLCLPFPGVICYRQQDPRRHGLLF